MPNIQHQFYLPSILSIRKVQALQCCLPVFYFTKKCFLVLYFTNICAISQPQIWKTLCRHFNISSVKQFWCGNAYDEIPQSQTSTIVNLTKIATYFLELTYVMKKILSEVHVEPLALFKLDSKSSNINQASPATSSVNSSGSLFIPSSVVLSASCSSKCGHLFMHNFKYSTPFLFLETNVTDLSSTVYVWDSLLNSRLDALTSLFKSSLFIQHRARLPCYNSDNCDMERLSNVNIGMLPVL